MRVLIPVEDIFFGSAIAGFLAKHTWPDNTEFRVINVVEPFFLDHGSHIAFASLLEASDEHIMSWAEHLVEEVAFAIKKTLAGASVSHDVIRGHVKDEIILAAKQWKADLIVAGSHGHSGYNRFLLGSVSLMLTEEAPCPVVLVKPDNRCLSMWEKLDPNTISIDSIATSFGNSDHRKEVTKILIAVDETHLSSQIVDFVIRHEWTQPARFKLVSVVRPPGRLGMLHVPGFAEVYQDNLKVRKEGLAAMALKIRDHYHATGVEEELIEGDPKQAIVESARQWGADLIVVGCHMKETLQKMFVGSVSLATLCTAPCSVLLVRQKAKSAPAGQPRDAVVFSAKY